MILNNKINIRIGFLLIGLFLLPLTGFSKENSTVLIKKNQSTTCNLEVEATILKQPDCGQSNGSVCLTVTGATGLISYSWGADIACYETLHAGDYCVYVTDAENCMDSVLFTLTEVCDTPCDLKITAEIKRQPECGKDNGWVCITATGGVGALSYSWGADIACYETLTPGEFCVYVTDEKNCKDSVLFTLLEPDNCTDLEDCMPFNDLTIVGTNPSCDSDNGSITVSVSGNTDNITYSWSDDATINMASRTDLGEGTYSVTLSNGIATCDTTLTISLNKDGLTSLGIEPNEVCPGEAGKVDFKIEGCFNLPLKVEVFDNTGNIVATIESEDGTGNLEGLSAGVNYVLGVTDGDGQNIVVESFEIITFPEIGLEETVSNECDAKGFIRLSPMDEQTALVFNWGDQDGVDNGGIREELSAGSYTVSITDKNGCETTRIFDIEEPIGPDITTDNELLSCFQDSLQLSIINNRETDTLSYDWKFPTDLIANATDIEKPIIYGENALTPVDAIVTVTNQNNCSISNTISITMRDTVSKPVIDFNITDNCNSTTINFINISADAELFTWNFGDPNTEEDISREENPSYTYPEQGAYDVTLLLNPAFQCNRQGEVTSSKTVMVEEPLTIAADYSFEIDNCNKPDTVEFINTTVLNRDSIEQFIWLIDGEIIQEGGETLKQDVRSLDSFDLSLIAISDVCSDTFLQNITFPKVGDTMISIVPCMMENVSLIKFFPLPDAIYNWEENPDFERTEQNPTVSVDTITEYKGTAQNEDGCVQLQLVLNPQDAPTYSKGGKPNVCSSEEETEISIIADEDSEVIWYESNDFLETLEEEDTNRMVSAGTYYFEVDNGCIMADSIVVTERFVNIDAGDPGSFCMSTAVQLSLMNQNETDTLSYFWLALPAPNNTSASPEVTVEETTEFEVEVTNQYGCKETTSIPVLIGDTTLLASQALVAEQNNIAPGGPTELSFSPPLPEGYSIEWTTDPTLMENGSTATVRPEETTTYTANIIADETGNSCSVQREIQINVGCNPDGVFFPNAFSPNGDGQNEILEVKGAEGLEAMSLIIFNRWGQKVFESNSPENGWDGVFNGEPVCADVYGYYLTVTCPSTTIVKKGNVTVLK